MFVKLFCIKFVLYKKLHKICLLFLSIPFMKFRSKLYFFINRKMTIINSILYRVKAEKMLLELDKLLGNSPSGICLLEYSPLLSPTFIFIHFINKLTKQGNGRVIFISLHTSAELFRVSMSKMAQRLDSDAMHFIALKEFFTNSLHIQDPMELLSRIFQEIHHQIEPGRPHLIIFDDLFFLSIPGFTSSKLFQSIVKLHTNLPQNSLILISTGDAGQLDGFTNLLFNFHIKMRPIGSGFGKNITGELEIIQRNPLLDTVPRRTILHYFCGQRSAKAFVPGSVQLLI